LSPRPYNAANTETLFYAVVLLLLVVGVGSCWYSQSTDCEARGGVLVRGAFVGWTCVEAKP
jgi:hypothetical protein